MYINTSHHAGELLSPDFGHLEGGDFIYLCMNPQVSSQGLAGLLQIFVRLSNWYYSGLTPMRDIKRPRENSCWSKRWDTPGGKKILIFIYFPSCLGLNFCNTLLPTSDAVSSSSNPDCKKGTFEWDLSLTHWHWVFQWGAWLTAAFMLRCKSQVVIHLKSGITIYFTPKS